MPEVLGRARQRTTAVLAALAVLAFAVLPAEHIHVAQTHDGHHSDLVHRHFEAHHREATPTTVDHAAGNNYILWLTTSFTTTKAARHVCPDSHIVVEDGLAISTPTRTVQRTVDALFGSVHAPPWATPSGLRAPPTILI